MRQKENFYFRPEKLQKLVLENYRKYGSIQKFAELLGIDNGNFSAKNGINVERWANPTSKSLSLIAVFFDLPLDYFFTDGQVKDEKIHECQSCCEKERTIEKMQKTIDVQQSFIDNLSMQVSDLQKRDAGTQEDVQISKTA